MKDLKTYIIESSYTKDQFVSELAEFAFPKFLSKDTDQLTLRSYADKLRTKSDDGETLTRIKVVLRKGLHETGFPERDRERQEIIDSAMEFLDSKGIRYTKVEFDASYGSGMPCLIMVVYDVDRPWRR